MPSPPATDSAAQPARSAFEAFRYRGFRFYAAARFLASVAVQMQSVAVGFQVYALTKSPLALGYVGLAQFVPVAGLSLVAGHTADRFDRRRVLFACDLAFMVVSIALLFISRSPTPSLNALFAVLVGFGATRAFYGPAGSALMPSTVAPSSLQNAVTWHSTLWQIAAVGGPSLGGAIYAAFDAAPPVYAASAVLFFLACILVLAVEIVALPHERPTGSARDVLSGLRYVWKTKVLFASISLDFAAVFLGGAVALLPVYATDVLHVGARGLGVLRSAPSVGAGVMALFLAFRPLRRKAGKRMLLCVAVFGVATIVFGLSRDFYLSLAALTVLGAADMVSVVVRMTLEQTATPPAMRGRVSAVNMVFVGASNELGEFESGTLASLVGAVPSVVIGGIGTVVVVALWSALFPSLRRVDRLEDAAPPAEPGESAA